MTAEHDPVGRMIAAQPAAARCADPAEVIFPDDETPQTPDRTDEAGGPLGHGDEHDHPMVGTGTARHDRHVSREREGSPRRTRGQQ
jgi:hypothetical protein